MTTPTTLQAHTRHAPMLSVPAVHGQVCRCVVCQAPLLPRPGLADEGYPTCQAVACRMVVSRRAAMGEAGFRHYLDMQARQRQHQAGQAKAIAARREAEADENAAAWSFLRIRVSEATTEPLALLLPSGPRRTRGLARERLERYRAHLLRAVAAVAALPAGTPSGDDGSTARAASSMPGQLCALCGGGCCTRGGEHAYLSAPTLRRFMDTQPELSADEVVAAYLGRVAVKTQSGSCINHTSQGCSLPREMRSDTCNRYACESLGRLQAAQQGEVPVQVVLVVRRKQDQWRRDTPGLDNAVNGGAVLSEGGIRRLQAGSLRVPTAAA